MRAQDLSLTTVLNDVPHWPLLNGERDVGAKATTAQRYSLQYVEST